MPPSFLNQKFSVFLRINLSLGAPFSLSEFFEVDDLVGVHTAALSLISLKVLINTIEHVGLVLLLGDS